MPGANRCFLPRHIGHITHPRHKKEFRLKFARDRQRWLHCLFAAKKRYGLRVLNNVMTSRHIHLLVNGNMTKVIEHEDGCSIREKTSYNAHFDTKMGLLRAKNTIRWDIIQHIVRHLRKITSV